MNKKAIVSCEINDLISNRWSPRAFKNEPIPHDKLCTLFEAARWAPSAFNEQPWQFILGIKPNKAYEFIYDSLIEFNKAWAKNAPVLIVALSKKTYTQNNKDNTYHAYDLGQAVAYLTIQAMAEGLYIHQMGGFDKKIVQKHFSIDDNLDVLTVLALGYIGNISDLSNDIAQLEIKERERKPLASLFYKKSSTDLF